jgi:hypothetical protein
MAKCGRFALGTFFLIVLGQTAVAADLFSIKDLSYNGAMRIPLATYDESRIAYANGTFVVDSVKNSLYVVGHQHHQAIAEFHIPGFEITQAIEGLPMAPAPIQGFSKVLDRAPTGNDQKLDRITGLELIKGSLVINAATAYDGNADNTDTTLVMDMPGDIKNSNITGYLRLDSRVHSAGWMTPIPSSLQDDFEGDYIFGYASNLSINGRLSMGPSAFVVSSEDLLSASSGEQILTTPLLDFSVKNQLSDDLSNTTGTNDLWTQVSNAYIGFIVPGTDTYAVFGNSGGHVSGVDYKIIQEDSGYLCGGYCPVLAKDVYNYYWFWNVQDLLKVKNGIMPPYELMPYEYGEFKLPYQDVGSDGVPKLINAASFDSRNNVLYFMLNNADAYQSKYESAPVLLAFDIVTLKKPNSPSDFEVK